MSEPAPEASPELDAGELLDDLEQPDELGPAELQDLDLNGCNDWTCDP